MKLLLFFFSIFPALAFAGATPPPLSPNLSPWMGNLWEFKCHTSYSCQHYHSISTPSHSILSPSYDHVVDFGLSLSFWPYYDGEMELLLARTHQNSFSFEATRGTLRYSFYDENQGDYFNLVGGGIITLPSGHFLDDPSVAFHGDVNGEVFWTIGKEYACAKGWIALGLGTSNRGKFINHGWYFTRGAIEVNSCHLWQFGLFYDLFYAMGGDSFREPFDGYAGIDHQSIDLGGYIKKQFCFWGVCGINYTYRLHARNFPEKVNVLTLQIEIPFGL
ncbi:MAG: hypothetical protein KDK55_02115 [Chlamydiia bacterium]|nr:hypothetical protein [Chlamydiia bacterium]